MNFKAIFEESGYVMIPRDKNFADFLSALGAEIKSLAPDYESGELTLPNGTFKLDDSAIQHRLNGNGELPEQIVHKNPLFGKRIVTFAHDFPKKLIPLLEHPYVLNHVNSILGTSEVVLVNGSIQAAYPGCTGGLDRQFHTDTANFSNEKKALRCVSENKFIVNVQVLLDDIDEEVAPMRILEGTHQVDTHLAINELVSKRLGLPDNKSNIIQKNWVYDELLEDFDLNERLNTGEKGCISLMNLSVLHGATANLTNDRVRRVAILNYVRKSDHFFGRVYDYQKSKIFCEKLENTHTVYDMYRKSARASTHIFMRVKRYFYKIKEVLVSTLDRIISPYYLIMRLRRLLEEAHNKVSKVKREYLNIGGGPVWLHERFFVVDQSFESDETLGRLNFDLAKDLPLPFKNSSLKGIYSSHFFEHLKEQDVTNIFKEAYRILQSGGTIRVVVPDVGEIFDAYERRDGAYADWFRNNQHMTGKAWHNDSWLRLIVRSFAGNVVDLFEDEELYKMYKENNREDFVMKILKANHSSANYRDIPEVNKSYWTSDIMISKLVASGFNNCLSVKKGITRDKIFSNGLIFDNAHPYKSVIDKCVIVEATK